MSELAIFGFWAKKTVSGLLLLPAGPIIVIALGLWLMGRRRRLGMALSVFGLVVLTAFSLPVVANALAFASERDYPPLDRDAPLPANAAIVVLGGGLQHGATDYGGETVNPVTLARLRSAARLAARTHLPILVTGGRPLAVKVSEAERMVDALEQDFHTPVRWIEKESLDTPDNARLSVPMLRASGIGTAVLVTDVEHMQRARTLFEAAGMPVIPAPTDYYANGPITMLSFIPNSNALRRSSWSLHEALGRLWSRLTT
ncbi:MAG: YdcF family protein [Burkholderiaceae bacterium]